MRSSIFLTACLLSASGLISASTIAGVCSTGFTNSTCTTLAGTTGSSHDGNFSLVSTPSSSTPTSPFVTETGQFPFTGTPSWVADSSVSEWISPKGAETSSDGSGNYVYTESFTLGSALDPATASIIGQWTTDNSGFIELNGVQIGNGTIAPGTLQAFASFTSFSITSGFHTGLNTLTFVVNNNTNGTPDVTGLNVQILSTNVSSAVPEPATFAVMGLGLAAIGFFGRKLRSKV